MSCIPWKLGYTWQIYPDPILWLHYFSMQLLFGWSKLKIQNTVRLYIKSLLPSKLLYHVWHTLWLKHSNIISQTQKNHSLLICQRWSWNTLENLSYLLVPSIPSLTHYKEVYVTHFLSYHYLYRLRPITTPFW